MAGPWEKYGAAKATRKPWEKYAPQAAAPVRTGVPTESEPMLSAAGQPMQAPPQPQERSLVDTILGSGMAALEGIDNGLANVIGLPVSAVNAAPQLLNILPGVEGVPSFSPRPFMGIEDLMALKGELASDLGMQNYEPQGAAERIISRVGEDVGAMALPGAAALQAGAKMGAQGARAAARTAGPVGRQYYNTVEKAAVDPRAFLRSEGTMSAGAGLGAGVANEAVDSNTTAGQAAEMAGSVAGVGLTSIGKAVIPRLKDVAAAVSGNEKFASRVTKENVVDTIMRNSDEMSKQAVAGPVDTTEFADALTRPSRAEEVIPGYRASTADRAGDFGLGQFENARMRANNSSAFSARRESNVNAIEEALAPITPTEQPGAFSSALEAERGKRLGAAGEAVTQAQSRFESATQGLKPVMTGEGRGADLRAALEGASEQTKELVSKAWEPINTSTEPVDFNPLADSFDSVTGNLSRAEKNRFAPREADLPRSMADEGPQPLNEITGIRTALTDAAAEAKNSGRVNEARVLGQYIDALDQSFSEAVPPSLTGQYSAARGASRDYADRFKRPQTAISQTLDKREGMYAQPDSAVTQKFLQDDSGRIADFKALIKETGTDARTRGAIRDQMLADIEKRGLLEKPEQLKQYIGRFKTVLDEFPDLRQELGDAGGLRQSFDTAATQQKATLRELGDGVTPGRSAVSKYLTKGEANYKDAMNGVINANDQAKATDELMTFVGKDKKAIEGARKAFWGVMEDKGRSKDMAKQTVSGTMPWEPPQWNKFLDDPGTKAVAERLYKDNPEHLENLRTIAGALKQTDLGKKAGVIANPSGTAQMQRGNVSLAEAQSKAYEVARGRVSKIYFATFIAGKITNRLVSKQSEQAFQKMLDRALVDPDAAAALLKEYNPANRAALNRSAKLWLGNQAADFTKMLDDEDETTEAIMRGKK